MKQTKSQRNDRKPLIVQTFPSSDVDDVFQNIFRTAVVCRGLRYVRQANFQSERAFMASMADDYIRPDDEVLARMRPASPRRWPLIRRCSSPPHSRPKSDAPAQPSASGS